MISRVMNNQLTITVLTHLTNSINQRKRRQDFDANGRASEYDRGFNDAMDNVLAMLGVTVETLNTMNEREGR